MACNKRCLCPAVDSNRLIMKKNGNLCYCKLVLASYLFSLNCMDNLKKYVFKKPILKVIQYRTENKNAEVKAGCS